MNYTFECDFSYDKLSGDKFKTALSYAEGAYCLPFLQVESNTLDTLRHIIFFELNRQGVSSLLSVGLAKLADNIKVSIIADGHLCKNVYVKNKFMPVIFNISDAETIIDKAIKECEDVKKMACCRFVLFDDGCNKYWEEVRPFDVDPLKEEKEISNTIECCKKSFKITDRNLKYGEGQVSIHFKFNNKAQYRARMSFNDIIADEFLQCIIYSCGVECNAKTGEHMLFIVVKRKHINDVWGRLFSDYSDMLNDVEHEYYVSLGTHSLEEMGLTTGVFIRK